MTSTTIRRISSVAHAVGTVLFFVAFAFFFSTVSARVPRALAGGVAIVLLILASSLLITYLALSAIGVVSEAVPVGRRVGDAWLSILVSIMMVGVAWIPLTRLIAPHAGRLLFVSPALLVVTTGLILHRSYRLHIRRPSGAVQPDAHLP